MEEEPLLDNEQKLSASFSTHTRTLLPPFSIPPMTTTPREFGLNKPTPFDGNRKKITTFIQEVKIYLTVNKHVYVTDESKVAFVLSYMTEKEAVQWKELYVEQMTDVMLKEMTR